jgi:hypothetical protein
MALTKYTYSISVDFPNSIVETSRLTNEIRVSAIVTALNRIDTAADDCDVWFNDALSGGDQTLLDGIVAVHSGEPVEGAPIGSLGTSDSMIGSVGANTTSSFYPSCDNFLTSAVGANIRDSDGSLQIRGPILTDEKSFRDDFAVLSITPTGTVTFTNGSVTVTGSGTAFLSEMCTDDYLVRTGDSDTLAGAIVNIVSNTELTLGAPYAGTSGTGASAKKWLQTIGAGGSITVGSSKINILSGTTSGSVTSLSRAGDYPPYLVGCKASVSQRIVNQESYIGMIGPDHGAMIVFDGTDNTKVKFRTSYTATDIEESLVSLPGALVTSTELYYKIEVGSNRATLSVNNSIIAVHELHIPGAYDVMDLILGIRNTGVAASSTTVTADVFFVANFNQVQVTNFMRGDPISIRSAEDIHTLSGYLTTSSTAANQVVVQYTVPAGKTLFATGYCVSSGDTAIRAEPCKIGRSPVTTIVSPGSIDNTVLRAFEIPQQASVSESWSSAPVRIGGAGDVVVVTVTPSGTTSTTWHAALDFILR